MNILMVDDQESVIEGLKKGIHWDELNFENVYSAFCASEAKEILKAGKIDILLCDIEMPGENGLQLLEWINQNEIKLKCIFLTSHAEFDYAKDALRKGSVDYLLQPAPYEEIEASIRKAIMNTKMEREKDFIYQYGKYELQDEERIRSSTLMELLENRIDTERLNAIRKYVSLPAGDTICRLVLVQFLDFGIDISQWDDSLFSLALCNISEECFRENGISIIDAERKQGSYVLMLYPMQKTAIQEESVIKDLNRISEILTDHLRCSIAVYCSDDFCLMDAAVAYEAVLRKQKENVSSRPGIFTGEKENETHDSRNSLFAVNVNRWMKSLQEGYFDPVRDEIIRYLDDSARKGLVTKEFLTGFHYTYMTDYVEVLKAKGIERGRIFDAVAAEVYNGAIESLDGLKRFVEYTISCLKEEGETEQVPENVIFLVRKYISDHIENDIKRPEIAEIVHLNEDYLTRLFKKETGIQLKEYIIREKMLVAQEMIRTTMLPISFIAAKIGYCNYSHFSKIYKKVLGAAPTDERKNVRK